MSWIQTRTGRKFDVLAPSPADVDIRDIAWALGHQCRFSGHTSAFLSVAQHSVLVSRACDPADAMVGLLHDATEAYLVDLPRPIKQGTECGYEYRRLEARAWRAVADRFHLPFKMPASVVAADNALLAAEARDLMAPLHPDWAKDWDFAAHPDRIEPVGPFWATRMFARRFEELTGQQIDWLLPE